MRSKLGFLLLSIPLLFTGCMYDYDIGVEYKPQVVINSIINPDSTIKAKIFWTREVGSPEEYNPVENFSAKIYENDDKIIFEGENLTGSIETINPAVAGAKYRIVLDVPEYSGIVSAETFIPLAPTAEIEDSIGKWDNSYHFEISKISSDSGVRSIIVRPKGLVENYETVLSSYGLYTTNAFCDQFNVGYDEVSYHDYFIRIPYKNLELATPLSFFIHDSFSIDVDTIIGYDDFGFPIHDHNLGKPNFIAVDVIAPSDDYDKYCKSTYLQRVMADTGIPIFNENIRVHSNVENGFGIFAGYSYTSVKVEIER